MQTYRELVVRKGTFHLCVLACLIAAPIVCATESGDLTPYQQKVATWAAANLTNDPTASSHYERLFRQYNLGNPDPRLAPAIQTLELSYEVIPLAKCAAPILTRDVKGVSTKLAETGEGEKLIAQATQLVPTNVALPQMHDSKVPLPKRVGAAFASLLAFGETPDVSQHDKMMAYGITYYYTSVATGSCRASPELKSVVAHG